jgi:RND family efflux transporter MFP subunit
MRSTRALVSGLTPLMLIALLVAAGAWYGRRALVRTAKLERQRELARVATTTVRKGEFLVTVKGAGVLEAVKSERVMAEVDGQVLRVVTNGSRVKKGDLIAVLDVPRMVREVDSAQLSYDNAKAELDNKRRDLEAEVKRAEAGLEQAKEELTAFESSQNADLFEKRSQIALDTDDLQTARTRLQRLERVANEGLIPKREVDLGTAANKAKESGVERQTKDLQLAEAKKTSDELDKQAAVRKAEADLARAKSKRDSEVASATAALKIQEQQFKRAKEHLGKATIRSPADGIVMLDEQQWQGYGMPRRPLEAGDRVWDGRAVASIPDLSQMRLLLDLPQDQARLVKKKQKAVIAVEAIKGVTFPGEVTEISQTAKAGTFAGTGMRTGERTFAVYVAVKDTKRAPLRPGMTARVQVIIQRVKAAAIVPLECVFDRDADKIVYLRRGTRFVPVEVELGVGTDEETVVTRGLKGGEEIALRDVSSRGVESPATGAARAAGPNPL